MTLEKKYGDSVVNFKDNWKSVGDLARKIAEKHGGERP